MARDTDTSVSATTPTTLNAPPTGNEENKQPLGLPPRPLQQQRRSSSATGRLRAPPLLQMPTTSSSSPVTALAVSAVTIPSALKELQQMTPTDRVKAEFQQRRIVAVTSRPTIPKAGNSQRAATPQRQRSDALHEERMGRLTERAQNKQEQQSCSSTRRSTASSRCSSADGRGAAWSKSNTKRTFSYQFCSFSDKFYPAFVPNEAMKQRAPGPGAYGGSTSFLVSNNKR